VEKKLFLAMWVNAGGYYRYSKKRREKERHLLKKIKEYKCMYKTAETAQGSTD